MKAAVLERRGADGVSWRDFPDPRPAGGESVLKVAASLLNRVDLYMRDNGAGITQGAQCLDGVFAYLILWIVEQGKQGGKSLSSLVAATHDSADSLPAHLAVWISELC